ncbi:MAG: hypothetical protein JO208_02415 [Alphaproteobacteria bacterium]|nr:hypothetical protein [Alphaproteobacteria bacterium]
MRKYLSGSAAIAALLAGACATAHADSYVPVPMVPGAASETAFGINDDNVVTGGYTDSAGVEHGFVGPLDGSNWATFDFPGAAGTEPRAIVQDGTITGFATANGFQIGEEFYRSATGTLKAIKKDKQPLDGVAQGLSTLDVNVGDYYDAEGIRQGYLATRGKYTKDFALHIKGWTQNSPRGITGQNVVAGYFIDKNGAEHGFIQAGSKDQIIDYPNKSATLTVLEDVQNISDKIYVSGQWDDTAGNPHGFVLNTASNEFTDLDPKDGSTFQQAWGMNGHSLVALSTSNGTSFIYCPYKKKFKCPQGGMEASVSTVRVAAGTFLRHDVYGRTERTLPAVNTVLKHGKIQ